MTCIRIDGDGALDEAGRIAFFETVWRAFLAVLSAAILIVCYSADVTASLLIGANVALLFAVVTIFDAARLNDDRPGEAPARPLRELAARAPHWAQHYPERPMLRLAKGASGIAIALAGSALLL